MINKAIFLLVIILAVFLRVVRIDQIPPGIYLDEASIGYDAYSLGLRGKDQYGASFPVYFRSYANYQSPLYIYLSLLPVKFLGLKPLGIRLVSILSGVVLVIMTYFLLKLIDEKDNSHLPLFGSLIIAISPWAILFSRSALEANLALSIFASSLFLLFYGINNKKKHLFLLGLIFLAMTNYAYHSYRLISIVTIIIFAVLFYRKLPATFKKFFILGFLSTVLLLIPQVILLNSPGSLKRLSSLEYTSGEYFDKYGGDFRSLPLGRFVFISNEFLAKYFDYLSPKSLFFDSDPTAVRSIPDLGAFYPWMAIPFFVGLVTTIKFLRNPIIIFLGLIGLISIIPAAITRDNLYLLRTLSYLWIISIIISLGCKKIVDFIKNNFLKILLLGSMLIISLGNIYINYFNILKNERKIEHSGLLNDLFRYTKSQQNNKFIVDLTEPLSFGVALFIYQYNPDKFEDSLGFDLKDYYSNTTLKTQHHINNLDIRPIDWEIDLRKDIFLVGDEQTIPEYKAVDNNLTLVNKFGTVLDGRYISIYKTKDHH